MKRLNRSATGGRLPEWLVILVICAMVLGFFVFAVTRIGLSQPPPAAAHDRELQCLEKWLEATSERRRAAKWGSWCE